jgi:Ni,Fe-hydrogenase III large subunit
VDGSGGADPTTPPPTTLRDGGDVLAGFHIRAEEYQRSTEHIKTLIAALDGPGQHVTAADGTETAEGSARSGVGIVEGWRGTIVHRIEPASDGPLTRVEMVDPSFFNWPALRVALRGAIVPDFPLFNKSF